MKIKKIFAVMAAFAVTAFSAAVLTISPVSAAEAVGKAVLVGKMGTYSQLTEVDALANASTVASIDGNAQYEVTWNIIGNGATSIDLLALQITGVNTAVPFTSAQYPNLSVAINEVYVDGVKATYFQSADSALYDYMEGGVNKTKVYLSSAFSDPKLCQDLSTQTAVKQQIKVIFTVSGLNNDGTSNVGTAGGGTPMGVQPTTKPFAMPTTSSGVVLGGLTPADSSPTGDTGVAAALAGLAAAAGVGITVTILKKKKK